MKKKAVSRLIAVSLVLGTMTAVIGGCGNDEAKAVQQSAIVENPITPQLVVTKRDNAIAGSAEDKIVFLGEQNQKEEGKAYLVFRVDGIYQQLIHSTDLHIDAILSSGNKVSVDDAEFMYPAGGSTYLIYTVPLEEKTTIARVDTNFNVLNESIVSVGNTYKQTITLGNLIKETVKVPPALDLQNHTLTPNITLEDEEKTVKIKKIEMKDNQVLITAGVKYKVDKKIENSTANLSFKNRGDILTDNHTDEFFASIEKDVPFTFSLPKVPVSKGDGAIRFTWEGLTTLIDVNTGKEITNTKEILLNLPILYSNEGSPKLERPSMQNKDDFMSDNAFIFKANATNEFTQATNGYTETLLPYEVVTGNKFKKLSIRAKQIHKEEPDSPVGAAKAEKDTNEKTGILVIYKDGQPFEDISLRYDETKDINIDVQGVHKVGFAFKLNKEQMHDNTDYYVLMREGTLE